jgi:hypothetical protein
MITTAAYILANGVEHMAKEDVDISLIDVFMFMVFDLTMVALATGQL